MLIGLSIDDTSADLDYMVRKLLSVRVFDSNQGPSPSAPVASAVPAEEPPARMWAKSVVDVGGEILCGIYFVLQGGLFTETIDRIHRQLTSSLSAHVRPSLSVHTLWTGYQGK